jgi:hypothetical protein
MRRLKIFRNTSKNALANTKAFREKSTGNIRKVIVIIIVIVLTAKRFPLFSCFALQTLAVNVWKGNALEVLWST